MLGLGVYTFMYIDVHTQNITEMLEIFRYKFKKICTSPAHRKPQNTAERT